MEKIKQKMKLLREEADEAIAARDEVKEERVQAKAQITQVGQQQTSSTWRLVCVVCVFVFVLMTHPHGMPPP